MARKSNVDGFSETVRRKLCKDVGGKCSKCRAPTEGGGGSIGNAAHISAASPGKGGLRYDPNLTPEQRHSHENGIWLCVNCHTLVDNRAFEHLYTVELLMEWKKTAIEKARLELERGYISDDLFFNLRLELDCTIYDAENDIYLIQANLINNGDASCELKSNYISQIMIDEDIRNIQKRTPQTLILPKESIMVNHTDIIIGSGLRRGDHPNAYVRVTFDYPGSKTIEQTSSVGELIQKANQHAVTRYQQQNNQFLSSFYRL